MGVDPLVAAAISVMLATAFILGMIALWRLVGDMLGDRTKEDDDDRTEHRND